MQKYLKVFVPLKRDGLKGWNFKYVCPGNALSISHDRLLLLENATVNRNLGFDDVCRERHAWAGYLNEPGWFEVSDTTGNMVEYPLKPFVGFYPVSRAWELQDGFYKFYNIKPHYVNSFRNWGTLDPKTGQWSGMVGMIQRDEVDWAFPLFYMTHSRSTVVTFSTVTHCQPLYWLTR